MRTLSILLLVVGTAHAQSARVASGVVTTPATPAPGANEAQETRGISLDELNALLANVSNDALPLEARRKAAADVAQLGGDSLSVVKKKVEELRRTAQLGTAMKALREENEGRMGDANFDIVDAALRGKHTDQASKSLLQTLVLIRALTHMKSTPATRELVALTEPHNGLFRPEITRQVKVLGEVFVPALIEARRSTPDVRRWALRELDTLGKRTAGDAAQVQSSQVLCDVLRAFGNIHDVEALAVILSFVNSDRAQVRLAARESLALYGGDGLWKLREAYQNLAGKPTPDSWNAEQVARELFAAYDRVRLADVYELLDKGVELSKQEKYAEACEQFDRVLARQPLIDRKREMIGAYTALARSVEDADMERALALYRKAARLDPELNQRKQIEGAIAYLDARLLSTRGVEDAELYRRAMLLDPAHTKAREAVERLEFDADAKKEGFRRKVAGLCVALVAVLGALLLGSRKFRRVV
jgi:hypothetical protein